MVALALVALLVGGPAGVASADDDDDDDDDVVLSSVTSDGSSERWTWGWHRPDPVIQGSLDDVATQVGARSLWQTGITGAGVDVAVIDTGVTPVPALAGPGKIRAVVDLSLEAGVAEAAYLDTYGHGTHMAGIIAGDGDGFSGVAPGAGIVSVKVADNTGAVDVSQVIAAIDWVVEHRNAGDLNIRVINLSYGTDSDQPYQESPLAYAVERAWEAGIVVVVAAGNDGWSNPGLAAPANDPYVIAVGAAEVSDQGTKVPAWASGGRVFEQTSTGYWTGYWSEDYSGRYPDLVAPGASIESLIAPGSRTSLQHPEAAVDAATMKGSGTSQAAAVVSGAVALLLEQRPELTPDQVKALLMDSADRLSWTLTTMQGRGLIDVGAAAALPTPTDARQTWTRSSGLGSLDAARGSARVVVDGVEVRGEVTVFGDRWEAQRWVGATVDTGTWTGSSWTGSSWTGSSWTGSSWTGSSWTGSSWTGSSWTGSSWTGSSWTGSSWTGSSWTGSSWTGSSWTGSSWTGSSWTGSSWTGHGWQ